MPISFDEAAGKAWRLDQGGQWTETNIAADPKSGERWALDGNEWVSLGKPPVDLAGEAGAVLAGFGRGAANVVGLVRDLPNAALSLAQSKFGDAYGVGPLARLLPEPDPEPVGGAASIKRALDPIGINTQASTTAGRVISRVAEEVGSAAVPMVGFAGLPARAAARVAANPVGRALAGTNNADRAAQLGISGAVGLGAGAAQEAAPGSHLAELGGALAGGAAGLGGAYVAGTVRNFARPFYSQEAIDAGAGKFLRENMADPETAARLQQGTIADDIVPGSELTTAQAAQDVGLAGLERTLRNEDSAPFATRDAQRAAAQRAELARQAPADSAGAEEVADMARAEQARIAAEGAAKASAAQADVGRRLGAVGPGSGPVPAGTAIREELGAARKTAKTAEKNLWNKLDDNEDLALEVVGAREAAQRMRAEMSPSAKPMAGDAAGVLDAAENLGDVVRWRELQDLRSWAKQTSSDLARAGDAVNKRRVDAVLAGIDKDLARAAGPDDAAGGITAAPSPGPRPAGGGGTGPAASDTVYAPDGQRIETEWRLVDLSGPDAPIVSNTPDFRPNPDYPAELQPRDRSRAASEAQVVKMAGELNPERLGAGGVGDGAPIIGPDRVTESGNGRLLAIDRAYRNGGRSSAEYRAWVEKQGYDTTGMEKPALVRVRVNELNAADRRRFTESANSGPGQALSAVEQSGIDAGRMGDDVLSLWRGGSIDDAANVDFARAFVKAMPSGDSGRLAAANGTLSVEGVRRIQGALLAKVFGNDSALVTALLETGDDNIRALGKALTDAAPKLAQLRAAIARGDVPKDMDPVSALLDAVRVVQRARKDGVPIGDVLRQSDAFSRIDPAAETFLRAAYGDGFKRVSAGRAGQALETYADEALRQTDGGGLFGPGPTASDVWSAAERRARGIADDATATPGAGGASGAVPPAGPGAAAGGGGAGGGGGSSIVDDGLTPNFGPDDAAAYRAAREATAERKATFDRGAPGRVLREGGYLARGEDGYLQPVEQVAGTFFNGGKASSTDIAEFLRAADGRPAAVQALQDYAVGDLRRVAVDDAGRIDAKKWANWMRQHSSALSAFPELRARFANVRAAQETLERVEAEAADAIKAFGKSSAGKFLDRDAGKAFAAVMNGSNRTADLRELVRLARGDEKKMGALRKAVVDEMTRRIENLGAVDAMGESTLSAAKTTGFLREMAEPLQKSGVLKREHVEALRRIEDDMRRKVFVDTAGRAVGSNTMQNLVSGAFVMQFLLGRGNRSNPLFAGSAKALGWLWAEPNKLARQRLFDAMLDPKQAALLAQAATPDRLNWVGAMLKRRATATGIGVATTAPDEGERRWAAGAR